MRTTNATSALNLTDPGKLAPFGKAMAYSEGDIVRESYLLNFTNKEIDYNLDLHYFGARYYTADFPRFISPDPVSGKLETPITWNRYLYCRNDPINYIDPDGRDVMVSDAIALKRIRSTVPAKLRNYITTTSSNRICKNTMGKARTNNQNFLDLLTLVSDAHLTTVRTESSTSQMGNFFFISQEENRQDWINNFPDLNPNEAIASLYLGKVDPISDSESVVILPNYDGLLSNVPAVEFAVYTAHELYGHMILLISGQAWEHEDEADGPVNQHIRNVENRTRAEFEE